MSGPGRLLTPRHFPNLVGATSAPRRYLLFLRESRGLFLPLLSLFLYLPCTFSIAIATSQRKAIVRTIQTSPSPQTHEWSFIIKASIIPMLGLLSNICSGVFLPPRSSSFLSFHPSISIGAEDGARTRDLILGKDVLYQLSYFRPLRGAEGQNRTDDTSIFSAVLYLLSYLGAPIHVNNSFVQCQVEQRSSPALWLHSLLATSRLCLPLKNTPENRAQRAASDRFIEAQSIV